MRSSIKVLLASSLGVHCIVKGFHNSHQLLWKCQFILVNGKLLEGTFQAPCFFLHAITAETSNDIWHHLLMRHRRHTNNCLLTTMKINHIFKTHHYVSLALLLLQLLQQNHCVNSFKCFGWANVFTFLTISFWNTSQFKIIVQPVPSPPKILDQPK